MSPSKVLWIVGLRVPDSTASRTYTIQIEGLEARQLADFRSIEDCQADSTDYSYSSLLCQSGISDLDTGVSRVLFSPEARCSPKCMSDKWKTFALFPLLIGTLVSAGFTLGNWTLTGSTGGALQNFALNEEQMYCPSKPAISAFTSTCVNTAPKLPASYVVWHDELELNPVALQSATMASGTFAGARVAASFATDNAATHLEQLPASPLLLAEMMSRISATAADTTAALAVSERLVAATG